MELQQYDNIYNWINYINGLFITMLMINSPTFKKWLDDNELNSGLYY